MSPGRRSRAASAGAERGPIPAEVREIIVSLDPLPALLTNGRFDILRSNAASEDLFAHPAAMLRRPDGGGRRATPGTEASARRLS
jgi:hypothetical protein